MLIISAISSARGQDQPGPQIPATVADAVFRSRWEGLQADRRPPRSAAGLAGLAPGSEEYSYAESFADNLMSGLWLGPVAVHPGLSVGWEYSDREDTGVTTTPTDDNSSFIAPTLALVYDREIGPWNVAAAYGAGWRYYFNPNYSGAGTGEQRNPFNQTASLAVGHLGARHKLTVKAEASSGTGYDVTSGENVVQTNLAASFDYSYILAAYTVIGARGSYSLSLNEDSENGSGNGELGTYVAGVWSEWLATGKVTLRLDLETGQSSQDVAGEGSAARNYLQALVSCTYLVTEKIRLGGGLGVAYVTDPGVGEAEYVGIRPRYELSASYDPTEKTSIRAEFGLLGADIRPAYRLECRWQPRVNTGLSVAIYQTQSFSLNVVDEIQVSRGVIGTLSQRLFSRINFAFSAGWEQTEDLSVSGEGEAGEENGTQFSYGFASVSAVWNLSEAASLQASWWSSTGGGQGGNESDSPETRITISANLAF